MLPYIRHRVSGLYGNFIAMMCIGYEPADPTVHPPPQNDRGWVHFFRIGV